MNKSAKAAAGVVQPSASSRAVNRQAPSDAFSLPSCRDDGTSLVFSVSTTTCRHRVIVIVKCVRRGDKDVPEISCTGGECRT